MVWCNHKKILCLLLAFVLVLIIGEFSIFSNIEGEYTVINSVQDQISKYFEGNLDDPNYVIVGDVPWKSSSFDENWMDEYSEGRSPFFEINKKY